jgi:hypothetical protein
VRLDLAQSLGITGVVDMIKRLSRIAPWQAGKTLAAVYFGLGVIIAIPFGLLMSLVPAVPGQEKPSALFFVFMPLLYALAALVFVPLGCWIYNIAARLMGGIEVSVETQPDA